MRLSFRTISILLIIAVLGLETYSTASVAEENKLELMSSAFQNDQAIPDKYTSKGENVSPPLTWKNVPASTQSFVLICDDPDAPTATWTHWVVFNIPPTQTSLEEGLKNPPSPLQMGSNSWGNSTYSGPAPPSGTHHYFFELYALDTTLDLKGSPSSQEIYEAMKGHILEVATLVGLATH